MEQIRSIERKTTQNGINHPSQTSKESVESFKAQSVGLVVPEPCGEPLVEAVGA